MIAVSRPVCILAYQSVRLLVSGEKFMNCERDLWEEI